MSGFGATGIGVDDVAEVPEGDGPEADVETVTNAPILEAADVTPGNAPDPHGEVDTAKVKTILALSFVEFLMQLGECNPATRVRAIDEWMEVSHQQNIQLNGMRYDDADRDPRLFRLHPQFDVNPLFDPDFPEQGLYPRTRARHAAYPRPDDGPARTRFRAFARQQARRAFESAVAGTSASGERIIIVESVKDAVKYIAKNLYERIDRW